MFSNNRKTELPEGFSPEMSDRNTSISRKSTMIFTGIAKTTYINPNSSKNSILVIRNNKNRTVPRPKEIRKAYFPVVLNFIFPILLVLM